MESFVRFAEIPDNPNEEPVRMEIYQTVVISLLLMAIYLPSMWFVFRNRNHPCILPRSPKLIMLEGASLFFDSLMNFIIMTYGVPPEIQCQLGIITTVIFHYLAFVSIVLRAYRIQSFFNVYNDYFQRQEEIDTNDASTQMRQSSFNKSR